ncbi:hypothetical protein STAQ_44150 [Allostella sp. ATCC 35155]|nr:hypothetical protein STAQ_44150 [Stella sp. ATCC 35155]
MAVRASVGGVPPQRGAGTAPVQVAGANRRPDLGARGDIRYIGSMNTFLTVLLVLVMMATLGVLGAGVVGMIRGGNDPRRSNALMRYRVLFQMAAVGIFALILWLMKS